MGNKPLLATHCSEYVHREGQAKQETHIRTLNGIKVRSLFVMLNYSFINVSIGKNQAHIYEHLSAISYSCMGIYNSQ